MSNNKSVFFGVLALCSVAFVGVSLAAEDAILVKVHDIKPVKNTEGQVVACEAEATVYNRYSLDLANSSISVLWTDEVVEQVVKDEKENEVKVSGRTSRRRAPSGSPTELFDTKNITLNLNLPPLKSYKQVVVKGKVNTDKCFLMIGEPQIRVNNCSFAGADKMSDACLNLFKYVSAKSPEYYTEFQVISAEEQKEQELSQNERIKREINDSYAQTVSTMNQVVENLKTK